MTEPKCLSLVVLIERFARKFGHHTARKNTAQGCKKRTFGWRASGSKRLLSSLLKCWIISTCRTLYLHSSFSYLISQTCVKGKAIEFVVSRSRSSSSPQVFFTFLKVLKSTKQYLLLLLRILTLKDMIKCANTCHVVQSAWSPLTSYPQNA